MLSTLPCEATIGGLRNSALNPAPGRLKRICAFARELGRMGTPPADAMDEIEEALWADGLLPVDRPGQQRAWRVTLDRAMAEHCEGMRQCVAGPAPSALAEATGDHVSAAKMLTARTRDFAEPEDIANALGLGGLADFREFCDALWRGKSRSFSSLTEHEEAVRSELKGWAECRAERRAYEVFATIPEGDDFAAALRAIVPGLTAEDAAGVASRAVNRLACRPARQYAPNPADPFSGRWEEPGAEAIELHRKARAALSRQKAEATSQSEAEWKPADLRNPAMWMDPARCQHARRDWLRRRALPRPRCSICSSRRSSGLCPATLRRG